MADKICTGFRDSDGLDIGCHLVTKEYMLENYPELVPWMKAPALWAWGANASGNIGDNTIINKSSPVQTISGGTNWRCVNTSANGSAGVKTDGTLWTWGSNTYGNLGDNTTISKSSPVQTISGGTNWRNVDIDANLVATKTDGTLWAAGRNQAGQIGDNSTITRSSPVQTISGGTNWRNASTRSSVVGATKTDGTLWMWGAGGSGQLGDNTSTNKSSPVQTISGGTNWKQIAAGTTTAAIKTDGTLWVWGSNNRGQLGDNTLINKSSPVQTISAGTNWKQVAAGGISTAAIKTDGTLWIWGNGTDRFNFDAIDRSSPTQLVSGGTNWQSVSIGFSNIGAIKTDGTLWVWGGGTGIGDNTSIGKSSPVQTISGGTGWKSISIGFSGNFAIRDEGEF